MAWNIKNECEGFLRRVLPADAPRIQREEMAKAFWAGVVATAHFHSHDLPNMTDDDAMDALSDVHQQLIEYAAALQPQN